MEKINSKMLINNIYYLLRQNNIKVGDLESNVGVSTGYFSKLLKDDNPSIPGTEVLYNVANYLNINITTLLTSDLKEIDSTEIYVLNFIDKLINNTVSKKISWSENHPSQLNPYSNLPPMFQSVEDPMEGNYVSYNSYFYNSVEKGFASIEDDYYIAIYKDHLIYCNRVFMQQNNYKKIYGYELYFIDKQDRCTPICFGFNSKESVFYDKLKNLYFTINKSVKIPFIDKESMSFIDDFMKNN